jgi:hypothetical protein
LGLTRQRDALFSGTRSLCVYINIKLTFYLEIEIDGHKNFVSVNKLAFHGLINFTRHPMKLIYYRLIFTALFATALLLNVATGSLADLYSVGYAKTYLQTDASTLVLQYYSFAAGVSARFSAASVTPPGGSTIPSLQPHGGNYFEYDGTPTLSSITDTFPSGSYAFSLTLSGQTYHTDLGLNPAGTFPTTSLVSVSGAGATWKGGTLYLQPNQNVTFTWTTPSGLVEYLAVVLPVPNPVTRHFPHPNGNAYMPAPGTTQYTVTGGLVVGSYQFKLGFGQPAGNVDGSYNPITKQVTGSSVPNALGLPLSGTAMIINIQVGPTDMVGGTPTMFLQFGTLLGYLSATSAFVPISWQGVGAMNSGWQERAVADINGDGSPDIIFQNGNLIGALILNASGAPGSWVGIGGINAGWQLRGAAKLTGDGNLDLIFQNGTALGFLEVNSTGVPLTWTGIGAVGTAWELRAVADLNGDGQPDLLFQNGTYIAALEVGTNGAPVAWHDIGSLGAGWILGDAVDLKFDGQPSLIFQNGTQLGALDVSTSFLPVAWHGIGSLGTGWVLPGDY